MGKYYLKKWGNPILREKCTEVKDFYATDLYDLISSMKDIMLHKGGCGLAAPQAGDNRQVIVTNLDYKMREFINPKIINKKWYRPSLESCLSVPCLICPKIRKYSIEVSYQDREGYHCTETFNGFPSVVMQHEIDHLNGKLIVDYFKK